MVFGTSTFLLSVFAVGPEAMANETKGFYLWIIPDISLDRMVERS